MFSLAVIDSRTSRRILRLGISGCSGMFVSSGAEKGLGGANGISGWTCSGMFVGGGGENGLGVGGDVRWALEVGSLSLSSSQRQR